VLWNSGKGKIIQMMNLFNLFIFYFCVVFWGGGHSLLPRLFPHWGGDTHSPNPLQRLQCLDPSFIKWQQVFAVFASFNVTMSAAKPLEALAGTRGMNS